jgi:AcrR family transcriptional regulator
VILTIQSVIEVLAVPEDRDLPVEFQSSASNRRSSRLRRRRRAARAAPEERQDHILKAALDAFSEHGFAATRLDDVAQRAGLAKGTLYLYFPDKEALFERVLQSVAAPALWRLAALAADETIPPAAAIGHLFAFLQTEIRNTPREKVIRLIVSEGPRFPRLAKFYYDEVVSKGLASLRAIAARVEGGPAPNIEALARFPQLLFAPVLVSIVWRGLFSEFEPLDVPAFLETYKRILLQPEGGHE